MGLYDTLYIIIIETFLSSDAFCLKTLALYPIFQATNQPQT